MRRRLTIAAVALLATLIIAGSFMPLWAKVLFGTPFRDVIIWMPGRLIHFNLHRTVHITAFGITALLAISLAASWPKRVLMALAIGVLALFVEAGEALIFRISMEWPDVLDDSLSVAGALLLSALWRVRTGSSHPAASER
jgi:hypothetical protein